MATTLMLNEPETVAFVISDDNGNAVAFETPPQWSWNDRALNVAPAENGMSAEVTGIVPGWTQIVIDAHVPEGVSVNGHSNLVTLVDLLVVNQEDSWDMANAQAIFTVRDVQFTRKLLLIQE